MGETLAKTDGAVAAEILRWHDATVRAAGEALAHARQCGQLLWEQKARLGHGAWLPWLEAHCPTLAPRTAQAYMRVFGRWSELEAKCATVASLPLRQALALLTESPKGDLLSADAKALAVEQARIRVALAGCAAVLDRPDATADEIGAVLETARECEARAQEVRLRAERGLGRCLERLPRWARIEAGDLDAIAEKAAEGLDGIVAMGESLTAIRDGRLYRETHPSFEAYLADRFGVETSWAADVMALAGQPRTAIAAWMMGLPVDFQAQPGGGLGS